MRRIAYRHLVTIILVYRVKCQMDMITADNYSLLDFGAGRKLERLGPYVIDRPTPAAEGFRVSRPAAWAGAQARFERGTGERGTWKCREDLAETWLVAFGPLTLELKLTEFGQVGLFPEQAENWDWIGRQVKRFERPLRMLNLFAYTGGATLAAAQAGAEVTHVDAARNVVAWARRNARHSGLAEAPIRWIAEDAPTFVARELRRGNRYDAVILDPPSYGHGPEGETWKLSRDLLPLLAACGELTAKQRAFMLLSCHSPGYGPAELEACLAEAVFGHCGSGARATPLTIPAADGRLLPSGVCARWPSR